MLSQHLAASQSMRGGEKLTEEKRIKEKQRTFWYAAYFMAPPAGLEPATS